MPGLTDGDVLLAVAPAETLRLVGIDEWDAGAEKPGRSRGNPRMPTATETGTDPQPQPTNSQAP